MIGEWTLEHSCDAIADQPEASATGKAVAKSYGGASAASLIGLVVGVQPLGYDTLFQ